jgi:hypothetical protein
MEFRIAEIIRHPRERVYCAYRNHLTDLVSYLPNVDSIETLEREQTDQGIRMLNRWKINAAIPRVVRPFLHEKMMTYLDQANWLDQEHKVNWRNEIGLFPEAIDCHGTNFFNEGPHPDTTEVALTGRLDIDLSGIRGVPRMLHGFAPKVESFILNLVRPNLVAVARAVGRFLDEGGFG